MVVFANSPAFSGLFAAFGFGRCGQQFPHFPTGCVIDQKLQHPKELAFFAFIREFDVTCVDRGDVVRGNDCEGVAKVFRVGCVLFGLAIDFAPDQLKQRWRLVGGKFFKSWQK
ncbi:hypothetical protein ACQE3E_17390 [Methylomonas sp. MED-D]|uniref:hypothetical protein n=1 Tax=unclassified Methylomonas TaxID=2608980 RepID=UPI0028A31CF5|nr:hypothetical protein [Methylomonas sp. MV1]MDT4330870.1 hypothetical protein [Methylomonas sp. MV1]